MVYPNLMFEMANKAFTLRDIARAIRVDPHTLSTWLSGREEMPVYFAIQLKNTFFPELSLEYLFWEGGQTEFRTAIHHTTHTT